MYAPGSTIVVADEFGQKSYGFTANADGSLSNPRPLAEEGEAGVTTDLHGNVYVCAGDTCVYSPDGSLKDRILVPERPTSIVFGGPD
ncbi:MAG: SMP-30/gluconolactonase/LRE family protein [Fimbriimonadaceae bacterium]